MVTGVCVGSAGGGGLQVGEAAMVGRGWSAGSVVGRRGFISVFFLVIKSLKG